MNENQITIMTNDGEELCDILFTHFDQETNKNYVVIQLVSDGQCTAMEYVEDDSAESGKLIPIEENNPIWDTIEEMLENLDDCDCGDDCGCHQEEGCCGGCSH